MKTKIRKRIKSKIRSKRRKRGDRTANPAVSSPTLTLYLALTHLPNLNLHPTLSLVFPFFIRRLLPLHARSIRPGWKRDRSLAGRDNRYLEVLTKRGQDL